MSLGRSFEGECFASTGLLILLIHGTYVHSKIPALEGLLKDNVLLLQGVYCVSTW